MNNKETLQNYNSRLDTNNNELASILQTINNLPESGGGSLGSDYVQDGLIALFDARDDLDSNNRWNSRIGSDYFYQSYPVNGTKMKTLKTDNAIVTDGTFSMRNNVDYQKQDYTIELVGLTPNNVNTNFLCFDRNQSTHININRYGEGIFSPQYGTGADATNINEKTINGLVNKRCTMAINIRQTFARGLSTGTVRTWYSVNGCQWYVHGPYALTSASSYQSNYCTLLSYYSTSLSGVSKQGEVNCIRVYNRRLTEEELKHNHEVDKINFNLPE